MSSLSVYVPELGQQPVKILTHADDIGAHLKQKGAALLRERSAHIQPGLGEAELLTHQKSAVDALKSISGLSKAQRLQGAAEPIQSDAQNLYFCTQGRMLVCLGFDQLYAVECHQHDAVLVPESTVHWILKEEGAEIIHLSDPATSTDTVLCHFFEHCKPELF